MTTHTHTTNRKWNKITKISIAAFAGGAVLNAIVRLLDIEWLVIVGALANLVAVAGLILGFIGAVKVFGGLKTGIITLVTGVVLYIIGQILVSAAGTMRFLGGEISDFNHPAFIIGQPVTVYGTIIGIVGFIMAVVTYLRRVLKAVESKA